MLEFASFWLVAARATESTLTGSIAPISRCRCIISWAILCLSGPFSINLYFSEAHQKYMFSWLNSFWRNSVNFDNPILSESRLSNSLAHPAALPALCRYFSKLISSKSSWLCSERRSRLWASVMLISLSSWKKYFWSLIWNFAKTFHVVAYKLKPTYFTKMKVFL